MCARARMKSCMTHVLTHFGIGPGAFEDLVEALLYTKY